MCNNNNNNNFVCKGFYMHVCLHFCACSALRDQRRRWILWDCSHRQLRAMMWVLGIEPSSSERIPRVLNCWPSFQPYCLENVFSSIWEILFCLYILDTSLSNVLLEVIFPTYVHSSYRPLIPTAVAFAVQKPFSFIFSHLPDTEAVSCAIGVVSESYSLCFLCLNILVFHILH